MSKIGRKPIAFSSTKIEVQNSLLRGKGPKGEFEHAVPDIFKINMNNKTIKLELIGAATRENKMLWGLHRALLANKIHGIETGFQSVIKIVGLGFKAQISGKKIIFTLRYTHKIEYDLPPEVQATVDKIGQVLTISAANNALLGKVCDDIRSFQKPEPYKGTGIMKEGEHIIRKAGKTKSSA